MRSERESPPPKTGSTPLPQSIFSIVPLIAMEDSATRPGHSLPSAEHSLMKRVRVKKLSSEAAT